MKRILPTAAGLAWSAFFGLIPQPGWANSSVQGVVYESTSGATRPLPLAFVSVLSPGGEILATIRADGQGRYHFVNLPRSLLALTASKPGYLTRHAAGNAGSRAMLDCSNGCLQTGMDFVLWRAAVLAGVVLDAMQEPVSRAGVSVRRIGAAASSEKPSTGATDNRGRFRIAGLETGSYSLTVQRRAPNGQDEVLTKTLKVSEGEQVVDLFFPPGSQGSFRVAGRVSGIPFGAGYRTWVAIRALSGSLRGLQASVGPDGSFQFDSVPAGRYSADAAAVKLGTVERTDYFLNVIEVLAEIGQIALQPVEPAAATGTLEITAGALPDSAVIRFTSKDGFGYRLARIGKVNRKFDFSGLRPGAYRVEADSTQVYVKGVNTGGKIQSPGEVILSPGVNRLTVVVAADHARVFGVVRGAPETHQPVPQGRVALHGDRGKYSVQADQAGRFLFGKVIPGEYRICAWANIAPERVEEETSWEQAGCQPKTISIGPSGEVEIDLRAAP
ncbi:MAG: carboxypeptidase regulatory-like domain-containing protein [Acidobacteriia bacterium]|nr:carboxypeptidase regulatory-like domain-containing protein [Terriglobia bacterium]